jgi:phage terminase large subunit
MELNLKATPVFQKNLDAYNAGYRYIINQGGSGSSKTFSLCQLFILLALQEENKTNSIIRKAMPDLKKSVMRDFLNILKERQVYDENNHNKTDNIYKIRSNNIEFFGLDVGQKVRGARRHNAWFNETNEIDLDSFRQVDMRTAGTIFLDFNPSDQYHWIYDEVMSRKEAIVIHSTYQDNYFLPEASRRAIEGLKDKDPNYWRVYGLGLKGTSQNTVYNHWQHVDALPEGEKVFGLDFGWSHPTALVEVVINDNDIYAEEKIYQSHLDDDALIEELKRHCTYDDYIYCDNANPGLILKIKNAGFNAIPANKEQGSVIQGIRELQKRGLYIVKGSVNLLKEIKSYSFRTKNDIVLDEPVKMNDDLVDALRYAVHSHLKETNWIGFV